MDSKLSLTIASLIPVVASAVFYKLGQIREKRDEHDDLTWQIIVGIVFGGIAILGTEWGIPMEGAMVNCRDAAPICAGLFFGGYAGIIAGLIGGIERWIAVAWGVGSFTRLACSVSTVLCGIFSAIIRRVMFDNKKPGWGMAFICAGSMEIFHLNMVFVTNLSQVRRALAVVKVCTFPMVLAVSCSVGLSALVIAFLANEKFSFEKKDTRISQTIQKWLMVLVIIALIITNLFMARVQDGLYDANMKKTLTSAIDDTKLEINDSVDSILLDATNQAKILVGLESLPVAAFHLGLSEINLVDNNGIIYESTNPDYIGFDFSSGEQSAEFLVLLHGARQFVQEYRDITYDSSVRMKYAGVETEYGFIQCGYDMSAVNKALNTALNSVANNRHIDGTGVVSVIAKNGLVISTSDRAMLGRNLTTTELYKKYKDMGPDVMFTAEHNGVDYLVMGSETDMATFTILAMYPVAEASLGREVAIYINSYMQVLVFSVLFVLIYMLIKRVVVKNIDKINEDLAAITGGNLDVKVNVRDTSEFASLSDDINQTVDTLKDYIAEAAARIDKELEFAKSIQSSALPAIFPPYPTRKDFEIYATMDTAKEVGGDFYDFYLTRSKIFNFLIADVSGKGIPAALFMMRAKTQLKTLAESGNPVNEVFTKGNHNLCEGNDAGMFVTAWQGSIDLNTGLVSFANAGHNPPLVKHKDGGFEYLISRAGLVLAGMDGIKYRLQTLQMEPGDILYLYTDGVTEATDAYNELYGEDRLKNILNSREFTDMEELCRTVKADVDAFVDAAPQFDDITMVAFKYNGNIDITDKPDSSQPDAPAAGEAK